MPMISAGLRLTHLCHSRVLGAVELTLYLSFGFTIVLIRDYDPTADYLALRSCFVELQAWEQSFEPELPPPEKAADPYLAEVFKSCAENSGRIFLAEANGLVVGFVCVLAKVLPSSCVDRTQGCEAICFWPRATRVSGKSLCFHSDHRRRGARPYRRRGAAHPRHRHLSDECARQQLCKPVRSV